jgi:hypothetical protein
MTGMLNALQDRAFLLDAALNYRPQQNPMAYLRSLLVPAVLKRQDWWRIFAGRNLNANKQRQRVDFALAHLRKHCSTDVLLEAAVDYLREHLE